MHARPAIAAALFLCLAGPAAGEDKAAGWIVEKPIQFGPERKELMKEYAKAHYGMDHIDLVPRMVVVHWTGGHSLKAAWKNFNRTKLAGRPFLQKYGKVNVAAHFLVDRDGTVYRLMSDDIMGRHVIGLNHCSLGIENIGNNDLTKKQLKANARLVEYLAGKHDTLEYLIGHYEYLGFEGSPLFIEKFPGYRTKKKDPGKEFMAGLRTLLLEKGIELASKPLP